MEVTRVGRNIYHIPSVHLCTIIWLHGLGDSAEGFTDLFLQSPLLPNSKVVLLTAPNQPVTLNRGMKSNSWYDITYIGEEYHPSVESTVPLIISHLEEESKHTDHLFIGGFSQGAAMSLYVGLSKYTGKLDGIIALSGYAFPMTIPESRKQIPVLISNGEADPMLTYNLCRTSFNRNLGGVNATYTSYPDLVHTISMKEWREASSWLRSKLNY